MDGVALAAKYSFITNRLKYCGPNESHVKFLEYIKNPTKELGEEIKSHIVRFEGLYPYLEAIAKKSKKDIFDYDVVESYWIGNKLLDKFKGNDTKKVIMSLTKRGLPKSYGEKLCINIPNMLPHHSFNVIYVGVGKVTGSVEFNIENINNCLIRPAEVLEVGEKVRLRHRPYMFENGKLLLSQNVEEEFDWQPEFTEIRSGDIVSVHWKFLVDILNDEQHKRLLKYTFLNVLALNNHGK